MPQYRRAHVPGGTFFFTLVSYERREILTLPVSREALRKAFLQTRIKYPFEIIAICLLPNHLHCIWTLPDDDPDYSTRWRLIKTSFSRQFLRTGGQPGDVTSSQIQKGESGVWQRRFWEHTLRDEADLNRHVDYIHFNPVKHGLVKFVEEWPWSSFHRYVREGYYPADWGSGEEFPVARVFEPSGSVRG